MSYDPLDVNILQENNNKIDEHVQRYLQTGMLVTLVGHSLILWPCSELHPLLGNEPQGTVTPLLLSILGILTVISVLHKAQL